MNAPRRVARCGRCGREGHYAPTCVWPEAAPAPAATSPAPTPKPAPAAPAPEAASPKPAPEKPRRVAKREKPVESSEAMLARVAADEHRRELAARPYEHTLRERGGDFVWRHTWTHHQTGEQLRMTTPLPPSGDRYDVDWSEGFVVVRYVRDAETLATYHKDSVIERLTAGGAVVERLWHELRREAKAPESPWSPA